ncbi:lipoate--protein ligase [Piscirickettsia salmonis]|uniref:lipoate--protein ligase n=1 Tax=Piscirickettsia salmonis TaxID=1238 RepID=UPI0007C9035E|nr:Lipoate-protein ligase A [Piscirickettsiaceae bacterium NZ-RLO1]
MKLLIYQTLSHNPHLNLAFESYLLDTAPADAHILYLWQNSSVIVIGRSQNPWLECHTEKMTADSIQLARRPTGGGAVYHDLGNTNFSFISPKHSENKDNNFKIILSTLAKLNIHAHCAGRNDLHIETDEGYKKISGSAFYNNKTHHLHHGTLLISASIDKLTHYLNPNKKKLIAKGITSVKSRVTNLITINQSINHENLSLAIINRFQHLYNNTAQSQKIDLKSIGHYPHLSTLYHHYKSWEWCYGKTLSFTHAFERKLSFGLFSIQLIVKNAQIQDAEVYSDTLNTDIVDHIKSCLVFSPYSASTMPSTFSPLAQIFPQEAQELSEWFTHELQ